MKGLIMLSLVAVVLLAVPATATIIHVPGDYPTIQGAIDASSDGDTVLVDPGTYVENVNFNGKAIIVTSSEGAEVTTIQAANVNQAVVSFISGEPRGAEISGFTITGTGHSGIICDGSSPSVLNNIITGNSSSGYNDGAGIDLNNTSGSLIRGNIIHSNTANTHGPAIHLKAGSENDTIAYNVIYNNVGYHELRCLNSITDLQMFNNTIHPSLGHGIHTNALGDLHVRNNIIFNAPLYAVYNDGGGNVIAEYNCTFNNGNGDYNFTPGEGNIFVDAMFVDPDNSDYSLQADSPCIDAGHPDPFYNDPDGTRNDMGAFYFDQGVVESALDIGDVYGENGQPVVVPVLGYGMENEEVAGVELHVSYDGICLEFASFSSDFLIDALVNVVDGGIHILWEDYLNPIAIPDSATVFDLEFTVMGQIGDTCLIGWFDNNELVDPFGEVIPGLSFLPGSVNVVEFHSVSGRVVYYDLVAVMSGVTVELTGDYSATDVTDESGAFSFEDLFPGSYTICASRSENDSGVTVTDIVKIRRHLVRLELLDSPYKLIGADVNETGTVSVADIIKMRRYLAELEDLPSGNWAFVDSSFAITDDNWLDAPRCIGLTLWDEDLTDSSFVGIRMGDVDNSWGQGRRGISPPELTDTVVLDLIDCYGLPGDTVRMTMAVAGFIGVAGLELHLEFPADRMKFIAIGSDVMSEPTTNGINGSIHFVWEDIFNTVTLEDGERAVSMFFEITEDASDSMKVSFAAAYVADEMGTDFLVDSRDGYVLVGQTSVDVRDRSLPSSFRLEQNYPNPFNAATKIEYDLPERSHVTLEVYDLLGRKIETLIEDFQPAGYYQVTWDTGDQPSGVYFYRLQTGEFIDTRKMLLLK